jgi:hypothetical protein
MVRTLDPTLESGQQALSMTPHIDLVFTRPATNSAGEATYNYASRILQLEHHEEVYNDYATLVLDNSDRAIANLKGYWVEIAYGLTIGGVDYTEKTARLWVKQQVNVSSEGVLKTVLRLEGVWNMLAEQLVALGSPPFYTGEYTDKTIYEILEDIIEVQLVAATGYNFTLKALGTQDDGIINTFIPFIETNQNQVFENMNELIQSLMAMTYCWLRANKNLEFEVIYPQDSDAVGRTYYSDQVLYFKENSDIDMVLVPNHFIVFYNQDPITGEYPDPVPTAEAEDLTEQIRYTEVTNYHLAGSIVNATDAQNRANVLLEKAYQARFSGRLTVMHDAAIELFDSVKAYDTRGL